MANAHQTGLPAPGSIGAPVESSPSSASFCPGCAKPIDPLRAGHVAVFGGRFHYFCRADCKREYLRAEGRLQEDVATVRPPPVEPVASVAPVASRKPAASIGAPVPVDRYSIEPALPTRPSSRSVHDHVGPVEPVGRPEAGFSPPRIRARVASFNGSVHEARSTPIPPPVTPIPPAVSGRISTAPVATSGVVPVAAVVRDSAPSVRRPIDSRPAPPPGSNEVRPLPSAERPPPTIAPTIAPAIAGVGIGLGALVPAIGLLGAAGEASRVPLAAAAWIALTLRTLLTPHDPASPHPAVALLPSAGAIAAATGAWITHDPRASAIAIMAGLACAVSLIVDVLVSRASIRVQVERERIERALDVRVRAVHGDDIVEVAASEVRPGEQVVAQAGEIVGVDATVIAGEASVVPWLGARVEILRREGDPIVAGARVASSSLRVTTTWSGHERAWVKLLSVRSARIDVASPTARLLRQTIERGSVVAALLVGVAAFAANATPIEILAAMSAGAIAFGGRAIASFVALHFARAHLEALASGITYKDPRAFERAAAANIAVLSARGTVLMGEPEIVAIESIGAATGADREKSEPETARLLSLAAGAETASSHPFAAAILHAARTRGIRADHVRNATVHAGLGVTALASSGERLVVGGRAIMLEQKIGVAMADARVTELEAQGRSVLLVALGDRLVGLIALQDGLRPGARAAVQRLLDARIEPVLLSGEARDTCETIGRALDIEHVRPGVLPPDRGSEVRALAEGGHLVAVVGHPAGDDGVLAAADVAVAMGAAGSTPGEWAVALASDDVRDAARALAIPHTTRDRVRAAVALGAAPEIVALLAIAFGIAPLAVAPLAVLLGTIAVAVHARESAVDAAST